MTFDDEQIPVLKPFRRFVWGTVAASLVAIAGLLTFSILVDPYWLFNSPQIEGFNEEKIALGKSTRSVKPQIMFWDRPEIAIVGGSSAEAGFDPDHPSVNVKTFNFALGGGRMNEAVAVLEFAAELGTKRAIITLDFQRFHADRRPGQLERGFGDEFTAGFWGNSGWLLPSLRLTIGADALIDAFATVTSQTPPKAHEEIRNRARIDVPGKIMRNGLRDPEFAVALAEGLGGPYQAFEKSAVGRAENGWFRDPCRVWRFENAQGVRPGFDYVQDMIDTARIHEMDVVFVIPPTHALIPDLLQELELYGEFETWKRDLVAMLEADAQRHDYQSYPLYDFGVVTNRTMAAVPKPTDVTPIADFTDPLHFRPSLGGVVLDRLFSGASDDLTPGSFGHLLASATVEQHLDVSRAAVVGLREHRNPAWQAIVDHALQKNVIWRESAESTQECAKP